MASPEQARKLPLRDLHPQDPPRRGSSRSSTRSTRSARPAPPISSARSTKAGPPCPTATTMAASPAARWSARPCSALLADVAAGRIDVVVVYKVDRLTRALADFARIVAIFDAAQVSFVSVTQAFNTTSSMGRLTLNVLLVLRAVRARGHRRAHPRQDRRLQGEGHVDGRHGADRLPRRGAQAGAACRRRRRWCGAIFERYLALGSVPSCRPSWSVPAIRTPERLGTATASRCGGAAFSRGKLYAHARQPALHRPHPAPRPGPSRPARRRSSTPDLWEAVQERLAANRVTPIRAGRPALSTEPAGRPAVRSRGPADAAEPRQQWQAPVPSAPGSTLTPRGPRTLMFWQMPRPASSRRQLPSSVEARSFDWS